LSPRGKGPAVKTARTPRRVLYRIGYAPNPLIFPPWRGVGMGRFDDPFRE
jgi:hypothetical protein